MKKLLRIAPIVLIAFAALAALAPYIPATFLRSHAEAALSRSLNRPVAIGDIRFTFFPAGPVPGPGFTLEDVTIHEDPRVGIEPFAHMPELGASMRILSLLRGHLEFSGINLGEASVNLVKTQQGVWNFQYLLNGSREQDSSIPALRMRGGRVNFKFADTKSVFFFREADFDVAPTASGALELRFSGAPSRSDHTQQDFGRLFVNGTASTRGELNFNVELQRSSLEEVLRMMDPQGFGVHGIVALNARLRGNPDNLQLTGQLNIGDVHRWDLLPDSQQTWQLPFSGSLNLRQEHLTLDGRRTDGAFGVHFEASNYLSTPQWNASADFTALPLATLFEIARHMGSTLPETMVVDGTASGSASYAAATGLTGALRLSTASLKLTDGDTLQSSDASLRVEGGHLLLAPTRIVFPGDQTAQMEGKVGLASPHALDLRITTRGLSNKAMRSFGLPPIPFLGQSPTGTWRGWVRYQDEKWTGAVELTNGRVSLPDLSTPIEVHSASLSLNGDRLNLNRLLAKTGDVEFTASYEDRRKGPPRFAVTIESISAEDWEQALSPLLARSGPGFISRALRLRPAPPPAWIANRHAEGAITIESATAGEWTAHGITAQVAWDGPMIHLSSLNADVGPSSFDGQLDIDVTSPSTHYQLEGALRGVPFRGGMLDLNGTVIADGSGGQLLETAHAEGTAIGRGIVFGPGAFFRTLRTGFRLQALSQPPRWRFTEVEIAQGPNNWTGTGVSQDDGRILLELAQGDRTTRYTGQLFPPATPSK